MNPSNTDTELFRALSARVIVALDCLDKGNTEGAKAALDQVRRCLPRPRAMNVDAAQHAAARARHP